MNCRDNGYAMRRHGRSGNGSEGEKDDKDEGTSECNNKV